MNKVIMLVSLLTVSVACVAGPIEVEVIHSGSDDVGKSLAFQIRENVRKSEGMVLVYSKAPSMVIQLITLESDVDHPGNSTTYSVNYLVNMEGATYPLFISGSAGYVGLEAVKNVAEGMVANLDGIVSNLFTF